jgi:hypothetical protein
MQHLNQSNNYRHNTININFFCCSFNNEVHQQQHIKQKNVLYGKPMEDKAVKAGLNNDQQQQLRPQLNRLEDEHVDLRNNNAQQPIDEHIDPQQESDSSSDHLSNGESQRHSDHFAQEEEEQNRQNHDAQEQLNIVANLYLPDNNQQQQLQPQQNNLGDDHVDLQQEIEQNQQNNNAQQQLEDILGGLIDNELALLQNQRHNQAARQQEVIEGNQIQAQGQPAIINIAQNPLLLSLHKIIAIGRGNLQSSARSDNSKDFYTARSNNCDTRQAFSDQEIKIYTMGIYTMGNDTEQQ